MIACGWMLSRSIKQAWKKQLWKTNLAKTAATIAAFAVLRGAPKNASNKGLVVPAQGISIIDSALEHVCSNGVTVYGESSTSTVI